MPDDSSDRLKRLLADDRARRQLKDKETETAAEPNNKAAARCRETLDTTYGPWLLELVGEIEEEGYGAKLSSEAFVVAYAGPGDAPAAFGLKFWVDPKRRGQERGTVTFRCTAKHTLEVEQDIRRGGGTCTDKGPVPATRADVRERVLRFIGDVLEDPPEPEST